MKRINKTMTIKKRLFLSNILMLIIPVLVSILVIMVSVLVTNWFLTKFVFKKIETPLDILTDGVHEISDGDLDYRIDYSGKDEFRCVCDATLKLCGVQDTDSKRDDTHTFWCAYFLLSQVYLLFNFA